MEISPGVVVVDLTIADLAALTPGDLREAFDDAAAQLVDAEADPRDLVGDLDNNPL